ncbi:MAG: alpha/beta fold hydrolase, partial [Candidatus Dormiibacterota bacterium]
LPDMGRGRRLLSRIESIAGDAHPGAILTIQQTADLVRPLVDEIELLAEADWIVTDTTEPALAAIDPGPSPDEPAVAYLQYTSGSTSVPKGVMVTHASVLSNIHAVAERIGVDDDAVSVSWLPHYHDMGLLDSIVRPLLLGYPSVLMPPLAFLEKPSRWLEAISKYRGTIAVGPNFAFDLCIRATPIEARIGLDLSSLTCLCSGAEPIRADTMTRFIDAFGPCGLRPEAMCMAYGLAEATLTVSIDGPDVGPVLRRVDSTRLRDGQAVNAKPASQGQVLVGSGRPVQHLVVVDPATGDPRGDDQVGEVWISGGSVTAGYWNRPEESAETFGARLSSGEGPFLRTGDLGFLSDGELFITGRIKDLIIIHGANYYPQDIEITIERSHALVRKGCVAAFAITTEQGEGVAVACEVKTATEDELEAVVASTRAAVAREHGVPLSAIALIKPQTIAKTSSGKIQRHASRGAFLAGSLETLLVWGEPRAQPPVPSASLERIAAGLSQIWQRQLGIDAIRPGDSFFDIGGTSLLAVEMLVEVEEMFGVHVPLSALVMADTVEGLAGAIDSQLTTGHAQSTVVLHPGGTKPMLFFVEAWDEDALGVRNLARHLALDQPVCGLGRPNGDGPPEPVRVEDLVDYHRATIQRMQPSGPYQLCGYSFGGLLAIEIAHRLRSDGEEVGLVALIDAAPINNAWTGLLRRKVRRLWQAGPQELPKQLGSGVGSVARRLKWRVGNRVAGPHHHPANERANEAALDLYNHPPRYGGAVAVLTTDESVRGTGDEALGWRQWVDGDVRAIAVPGSHDLVLAEPAVGVVGQRMAELLDEAALVPQPC